LDLKSEIQFTFGIVRALVKYGRGVRPGGKTRLRQGDIVRSRRHGLRGNFRQLSLDFRACETVCGDGGLHSDRSIFKGRLTDGDFVHTDVAESRFRAENDWKNGRT